MEKQNQKNFPAFHCFVKIKYANFKSTTIDTLKRAWKNLYTNNSENVIVLNDGLEFQEASNNSVEMQLDQNKNTLTAEIKSIFHIKEDVLWRVLVHWRVGCRTNDDDSVA